MARGDPTYAHIDVDWPEDPRSKCLSASENWLYEVCLLTAVRLRSNCLTPAHGVSYLCRRAAVRQSAMKSLLRKSTKLCPEAPMIFTNEDGCICLKNVGKRHPKLDWNGPREGPTPSSYGADMGKMQDPSPLQSHGSPTGHRRKTDAETKPNAWAWWVEVNREMGRAEPAAVGPDLAAAKTVARLGYPEQEVRDLMRRFLADQDPWLVKNGHALRHLSGKLNAYRSGSSYDGSARPNIRNEGEHLRAGAEELRKHFAEKTEREHRQKVQGATG